MYFHKVTKFCSSTIPLPNSVFSNRKSNTCHARYNFSQIFTFCPSFFKIIIKKIGSSYDHTPLALLGWPIKKKKIKKIRGKVERFGKNYHVCGTCLIFRLKRWKWVTKWSNCKIL